MKFNIFKSIYTHEWESHSLGLCQSRTSSKPHEGISRSRSESTYTRTVCLRITRSIFFFFFLRFLVVNLQTLEDVVESTIRFERVSQPIRRLGGAQHQLTALHRVCLPFFGQIYSHESTCAVGASGSQEDSQTSRGMDEQSSLSRSWIHST